MSRAARLQSGRHWLASHKGKHVVRSYARWFGVNLLCAARELQALGVRLSAEYLEQLGRTVSQPRRRAESRRRPSEKHAWVEPSSDEHFACIVGYTPAGLPFGVTWEEVEDAQGEQAASIIDDDVS